MSQVFDNHSLIEIKKKNLKDVFKYICENPSCSKRQIGMALNISIPTVNQHITELIDRGLIEQNGLLESNLGRKAASFTLIANSKISVGVELSRAGISLIAMDLRGYVVGQETIRIRSLKTEKMQKALRAFFADFLSKNQLTYSQILGVGISVQGMVSSDGSQITYSTMDLQLEDFVRIFDLPCRFIHDTECAANMELWLNPNLKDAFYLSVGDRLGGALIIDHKLHGGLTGKTGLFEHMTLVPNGKLCYCGAKGCADCYCSTKGFLRANQTLKDFFDKKAMSEPSAVSAWNRYLDWLALFVNNLHTAIDCDVIIGGKILPYLSDEDINALQERARIRYPFGTTEKYIMPAQCMQDPMLQGAALVFMQSFINNFPGDT